MADTVSAQIVPIRPEVRPMTHMARPIARGVRLIAGEGVSPHDVFRRTYLNARIARASRELIEAQWALVHHEKGKEAGELMGDERDEAFQLMRRAVVTLAVTPAMNRNQLSCKLSAIGSVWLKAEGRFYDMLRLAVAKDEIRLGVKSVRTEIRFPVEPTPAQKAAERQIAELLLAESHAHD